MAQAKAYIVGTLDTKGEELLYIRDLLAADGVASCVVDVGTGSGDRPPGVDVSAAEVAAHHPEGADAVLTLEDRGQAVAAMGAALARFLPTCAEIGGVIGAGGSGNTALVSRGMQALPIGVPRVLVSTVASGDIGSHLHNLVRYVTGLEIEAVFAELASLVPGRVMEDDAGMLVRFVGGARGVYQASQVSAGEENGLALRVYGESAGLVWRQEDPNVLDLLSPDGPRQRLTRGSGYLCAAALHASRVPPGHPEGFIEAFANIYRCAGRVIGAGIAGAEPDPLDHDFPDQDDGLRGVRFIAGVLDAAARGRWTALP